MLSHAVVLAVIVASSTSACTASVDATVHRTTAPMSSPSLATADLRSTVGLRPLRVGQLFGSGMGSGDTLVSPGGTVLVGKQITGGPVGRSESALIAFEPVPTAGRCVEHAELTMHATSDTTAGAVRLYPSAFLSFATGRSAPPAGSGGPGTLLDNQPAADPETTGVAEQRFDVTDLLRLWADGGPFPSEGRQFAPRSAVVFTLQVPGYGNGSYQIGYSVEAPPPKLVLVARTGCT